MNSEVIMLGALGLLAMGFSFIGNQHPTNLFREPLSDKQRRINKLFYRIGGSLMLVAAFYKLVRF
jgi:hypothetical protein